jgi:phospholipid/cholesterol/gamma-HCH transport system ATP-binding protein
MPEATSTTGAATLQPPDDGDSRSSPFEDVSITFDVKPVLKDISFSVDHGPDPDHPWARRLRQVGAAEARQRPAQTRLRLHPHLRPGDHHHARARPLQAARAHRHGLPGVGPLRLAHVEDNVAYRLHEEHVPGAEAHTRVVEALKFVELEQAIAKLPSELSGGMRRRVSIARAIISNPDLILYDSPTGGLDPITSTTIIELVMKQRDVSHTTSLLVTHRLQDAFALATHRYDPATGGMKPIPKDSPGHGIDPGTKFLLLNEGHVVFHGSTEEFVHSDDPWINVVSGLILNQPKSGFEKLRRIDLFSEAIFPRQADRSHGRICCRVVSRISLRADAALAAASS